jgi:hypothetical protein
MKNPNLISANDLEVIKFLITARNNNSTNNLKVLCQDCKLFPPLTLKLLELCSHVSNGAFVNLHMQAFHNTSNYQTILSLLHNSFYL